MTRTLPPIVAAPLAAVAGNRRTPWRQNAAWTAFTNKQCETAYTKPVLETTYY